MSLQRGFCFPGIPIFERVTETIEHCQTLGRSRSAALRNLRKRIRTELA
ncbi:MAG: hypothetical protein ACO4AJ_14395 [Prochlorothrix sp.]